MNLRKSLETLPALIEEKAMDVLLLRGAVDDTADAIKQLEIEATVKASGNPRLDTAGRVKTGAQQILKTSDEYAKAKADLHHLQFQFQMAEVGLQRLHNDLRAAIAMARLPSTSEW